MIYQSEMQFEPELVLGQAVSMKLESSLKQFFIIFPENEDQSSKSSTVKQDDSTTRDDSRACPHPLPTIPCGHTNIQLGDGTMEAITHLLR